MFKLDLNADIMGTSRQGELHIVPHKLIAAFGQGMDGDGYKVSQEWAFTGEDGSVFTVYDYKMTTLYDAEAARPSEFWAEDAPKSWLSVGGRRDTDVDAFIAWLTSQGVE